MRIVLRILAVGVLVLIGFAPKVLAQDDHVIVVPDEITWAAGPPSLPAGAEAAVLYGDPTAEGLFALRLKLPADYHIPPHTHPRPEVVTVISGTFRVGTGETANEDEVQDLAAGGFFAFAPDMAHYAYTDEETVVQLNSVGPWALEYINPEDDPREASG
jgi:quercetin dioxygenase-like cupin family protein